jgi:hypothetical protein
MHSRSGGILTVGRRHGPSSYFIVRLPTGLVKGRTALGGWVAEPETSSYEHKMAAITTDGFCLAYEEMQAASGYALMREEVADSYAERSGLSDSDARFVMIAAAVSPWAR